MGPVTHLVALADAFVFLEYLGVSHVLIAVISTLDVKLPVLVERLRHLHLDDGECHGAVEPGALRGGEARRANSEDQRRRSHRASRAAEHRSRHRRRHHRAGYPRDAPGALATRHGC